jgi:hypothetical protein
MWILMNSKKELISLAPIFLANRPKYVLSMPKTKNLSWELCRDVIENRPLTKENQLPVKRYAMTRSLSLANNPACSIITAS